MTVLQIENNIRQLEFKDQLQLLSWFIQYVRQRMLAIVPTIDETTDSLETVVDDYDYPMAGTLIKCDDPFEPVAVDDWEVYQ
ncbi:MAG: hypothetical protein AAF639_15380 [Chloroflexota bacterium]